MSIDRIPGHGIRPNPYDPELLPVWEPGTEPVSIEKRREMLLEALEPEEKERFERLERELAPLDAAIRGFPEVERLHTRQQLGGKANPDTLPHDPDAFATFTPAFHTRHQHSELAAELAKVAAAKLGLSVPDAKLALSAAWLHDLGHSAFSHIGDELLMEHGMPGHEERAFALIRGPLRDPLAAQGVPAESLVTLIREQGALGSLQSALDTLSYLVLDTAGMGEPAYPDSGARVVADIEGIDPKHNALIVGTPSVWQELLDIRVRMMRDVYYHPLNRRTEEAKRQLLRIALNEGYMDTDELVTQGDQILMLRLQSLVQNDPGAALLSGRSDAIPYLKEYKELFSLAGGSPSSAWEHAMYETLAEANRAILRKEEAKVRQSFIVPPFDYTKKRLRLRTEVTEGTEEILLRASDTGLRITDTRYIVYSPK